MYVDAETDIVFRRLDKQIISRPMAREAIKYLASDCAAGDAIANQVDAIFDEHETTRKHPLLLAFRIKRLLNDHLEATEQAEPERHIMTG